MSHLPSVTLLLCACATDAPTAPRAPAGPERVTIHGTVRSGSDMARLVPQVRLTLYELGQPDVELASATSTDRTAIYWLATYATCGKRYAVRARDRHRIVGSSALVEPLGGGGCLRGDHQIDLRVE